ncbi:HTH_Tnp_Tc3_2 domain-containing protein [Trichonephila clavipes]|nr:HTH_Tnp_Tc3_2 domain-containing protein [Trichonephila clavipes]
MTPELAPFSPNYHTTPTGKVSTLNRFNKQRCPTWRVFSGTGLELVTRQATIDTNTTRLPQKQVGRIDVSAATRSERYGAVARCWQQWITEGRVYRRGGSGRPRNTNDREDRAIRRVATSAPTTSLASIQRHLPPSRHPVPSRETIRRRLTEVGLRSRRPLRRLPLTPHHRQCRLDFCRPGQLECDRLRRVIFSDESRFTVSVLMTTAHVFEAHRPAVRSGIYCRAAYKK